MRNVIWWLQIKQGDYKGPPLPFMLQVRHVPIFCTSTITLLDSEMVQMSSSSSRNDSKSRNDAIKSRNDVIKSRNNMLELEDVDDSEDLDAKRSSLYLQNHTEKSSEKACEILRVSLRRVYLQFM